MNIDTLIDRFARTRILCVGDVMLDKFMYGNVSRISPEAPVPIMHMDTERRMLGGAGNVVRNLAALGCESTLVSVIGADAHGEQVQHFLEQERCVPHLIRLEGYETTVKIRFVAGKHHLLRADHEQKLVMGDELRDTIVTRVQECLPEADLVLLSDYGKGVLDAVLTPRLIAACHAAGKRVFVDPKGTDYAKYQGASLVKPNMKEFYEATGIAINPGAPDWQQAALRGARHLFTAYGIENLLVTLSEYGMILIAADKPDEVLCIPTEARDVFDVSGAGDTSLATLGAAMAAGATPAQAMHVANAAAGVVVGKFGTAGVSGAELKQACRGKQAGASQTGGDTPTWQRRANIITREQAAELVQQCKRQHKTVGFTNGCFDLLHLGHLQSFVKAKEACDVLIVGINTDDSVRRLKGPSRPVNNETMRSVLVAMLDCVDYVVLFDEDTALPLLELLRPDVIAKEGYALECWPEGRFVQSYGGTALELPRLEGYSSTEIIQQLQQPNA